MSRPGRTAWATLRAAAHRLVQRVLAPGGMRCVENCLRESVGIADPQAAPWLDVGAGSRSRLDALGRRPIVVDLSSAHAYAARASGARAVVASADALPFADESFAVAACIGLLHHLPDDRAAVALSELVRVATLNGRVVVFDAVLPERRWGRPLAALIRALDRGEWMRREPALASLLPVGDGWSLTRMTYATTGLEAVLATRGGAEPCR